MKKICFALLFVFAFIASKAQPPASKEIISTACKKAATENKKVLLIFHASWCGWCHKMDSSLNNPLCKKYFKANYVITHLTVHESDKKKNEENAGADELLKQYKAFDSGIPFWVVLDDKGNLLKDSFIQNEDGSKAIIGCPATEKEVASFIQILKETSKLKEEALAVITSVFRQNEAK